MVIFIVEGITDSDFLKDILINYLHIPREKFEFKGLNGKDYIFKLHDSEMYSEIEKEIDIIDQIFIAVDADDPKDSCPIRGYQETEDNLKELISNLEDYNIPIDYYIFSNATGSKGYLEGFLLSVLDDVQQKCVENFKECYFEDSISDKWIYNSFYKQQEYPFDYEHPNFCELKDKLQRLFEVQQ